MAKVQPKDVNPDDYLDTELGYDMPIDAGKEASSAEDAKSAEVRRETHTYNPDDFSEAELGYEYEAGEEALE